MVCILQMIEAPGWPQDFSPEVTGLVLGFSFGSCFLKLEVYGFGTVPVLELFRTSWFHSGGPLLFVP